MSSDAMSRERREWFITVGAATAIAIVCGVLASSGEVADWEEAIFHAVNGLPDALEAPMWLFQLAGLLFVPVVVAAVAAVLRRWRLAAALVAIVPIKLALEHLVVKQLVERERPGATICGYPSDFDESCAEFRGDVPLEGLSFVSGHAVVAWAVATVLWPALPRRWRWLPVAIACLNATARVYLGAHNPLDVVGGAAVGIAIGAVLVLAFGLERNERQDHAMSATVNSPGA
jgi:undecaprenyl-diphosphatase